MSRPFDPRRRRYARPSILFPAGLLGLAAILATVWVAQILGDLPK